MAVDILMILSNTDDNISMTARDENYFELTTIAEDIQDIAVKAE